MPNFIEIAQTAVKISQFLYFSKWRLPLSWILKFLTVGHAKKVERLHCAKFRLNRSEKVELHQCAKFRWNWSNCGRDIVIFRNLKFLTVGTVKRIELRHRAKFHQNRSDRSRDMEFLFWIFQHGGRRHLGFSKFQIFKDSNGQKGRTASVCQISLKSV